MTLEEKLALFQTTAKEHALDNQKEQLKEYADSLNQSLTIQKQQFHMTRQQIYDKKLANHRHSLNHELTLCSNSYRQQLALKKEQQLEQLTKDAKRRFLEFKQTTEYYELLKHQIRSILKLADMDYCKLYLDASDRTLLPSLLKQFPVNLAISKHNMIGGIYAKIPGKNLFIDETISTKLKEVKDAYLI